MFFHLANLVPKPPHNVTIEFIYATKHKLGSWKHLSGQCTDPATLAITHGPCRPPWGREGKGVRRSVFSRLPQMLGFHLLCLQKGKNSFQALSHIVLEASGHHMENYFMILLMAFT